MTPTAARTWKGSRTAARGKWLRPTAARTWRGSQTAARERLLTSTAATTWRGSQLQQGEGGWDQGPTPFLFPG